MREETDTYIDLLLLRDAAATKRYHTQRVLREQQLSAHSFGVMQIIHHVWPECRKEVLLSGMFHDLPEYITGDLPAPAKRNSPQLAIVIEEIEKGTAPLYQDFDLTPAEAVVLDWADRMELCLWCAEDATMGNGYVLSMARRAMGWCEDTVLNKVPGRVPLHVAAAMQTITRRTRQQLTSLSAGNTAAATKE